MRRFVSDLLDIQWQFMHVTLLYGNEEQKFYIVIRKPSPDMLL